MKYPKLEEPVFVTGIHTTTTRNGGHEIWEINFLGIKSQQPYKTWIDPHMANYQQWQPVIAAKDQGVVISNLKLKNPDKNLINADSSLKLEMIVTKEMLAEELADYWQKQATLQDQYQKFYREL